LKNFASKKQSFEMEADAILTNLKLLIIGESGVGKSSLLLRFTDDAFDPEQAATIGVDFKVKTVKIDGNRVSLLGASLGECSCEKIVPWPLQIAQKCYSMHIMPNVFRVLL
jgi:GTPase SAR1 family protein